MDFKSVKEILDFAIQKEEEACNFYSGLAEKVKSSGMKQVFADFARQEQGHKEKLQAIKEGKIPLTTDQKVKDLKVVDHLEDIEVSPNIDYQSALIVAMKAEKNAFKLYNELAGMTENAAFRTILLGLAQEEANHKLRFEIEYDDHFLTEN
jgi:rubrerythrin